MAAAGASAGPASKQANDAAIEITNSNVRTMKVGRRLPRDTPLKLSGVEWVKYSDRATGKIHTCVGKYEGPLGSCPEPKPCGLVNIMSDECGKNGVALP